MAQARTAALAQIPTSQPALREAVRLTEFAFKLFPVRGIREDEERFVCDCSPTWGARRGICVKGSPGKHPVALGWQAEASSNPLQIASWARTRRPRNCGVATGLASNLLIVDLDGAEAMKNLQRLESELGALPLTVRSRSGREGPGAHLWFRLDPDRPEPRNTASTLAPKIDTRAAGGFALIPGSLHLSGRRYTWELSPDEAPFAFLPEPWLERLQRPAQGAVGAPRLTGGQAAPRLSTGLQGGHDGGPIVFGDQPGGQGFHGPIRRFCCCYFTRDPQAPAEPLVARLNELIAAAYQDPALFRDKYRDQRRLHEEAERARAWIISQQLK